MLRLRCPTMFQNTIQHQVSTEGIGLHTGVFGHVRLLPAPADSGIVFPPPLVGQQQIEMVVRPEPFRNLLARARTFCFERDIEPLRSMGLIRGGSLDNAIVLTDDGVMNGPLRFPDEFGRHKALDLIGDLALVGLPLLGRGEAYKAGHALQTQLVSPLLADSSSWVITTEEETFAETRVLAEASAAD